MNMKSVSAHIDISSVQQIDGILQLHLYLLVGRVELVEPLDNKTQLVENDLVLIHHGVA